MNIIGFNLTDLYAKRAFDFKHIAVSTDILFTEVEKAKINAIKNDEPLKVSFKFTITYKDSEKKESTEKNEVVLSGSIILTASKEEAKDFLKSWKTKEIPQDKAISLYNLILRKCSIKALQLEEDLGLSPHIPLPRINNQQQDSKQ